MGRQGMTQTVRETVENAQMTGLVDQPSHHLSSAHVLSECSRLARVRRVFAGLHVTSSPRLTTVIPSILSFTAMTRILDTDTPNSLFGVYGQIYHFSWLCVGGGINAEGRGRRPQVAKVLPGRAAVRIRVERMGRPDER